MRYPFFRFVIGEAQVAAKRSFRGWLSQGLAAIEAAEALAGESAHSKATYAANTKSTHAADPKTAYTAEAEAAKPARAEAATEVERAQAGKQRPGSARGIGERGKAQKRRKAPEAE